MQTTREFAAGHARDTPARSRSAANSSSGRSAATSGKHRVDDVVAATLEFGREELRVRHRALVLLAVARGPERLQGGVGTRDTRPERVPPSVGWVSDSRYGVRMDSASSVSGSRARNPRGDGRLPHLVRVDGHRVDGGVRETPVVVREREDEAAPGRVDVEVRADVRGHLAERGNRVHAPELRRARDADDERRVVVREVGDGAHVRAVVVVQRR